MIIVLNKKTIFQLSVLLLCTAIGVFHFKDTPAISASHFKELQEPKRVLVLDPGHGGEDGGATSESGVQESDLNLNIARRTSDLFRLLGQRVVMTRTEDTSLDSGENTVQKRKASDLKARTALVNRIENSVLVSIHQNSLPTSPITHGAQVFWNDQGGARELAESMQKLFNLTVNFGNEKNTRQIPKSIYLMNHCIAPAVLVECGFLSNSQETQALQSCKHQKILALSIVAGYQCWRVEEE